MLDELYSNDTFFFEQDNYRILTLYPTLIKNSPKRDAIRKEEILSAVVKSGRSYEEIMNFLNAGSDGEKTEK